MRHYDLDCMGTSSAWLETACVYRDSFTILGLWVLGLAVSNINESPLQTNESKTLFLMTSLPYYCTPDSLGLAEIKTYAQKMQDARVTKSLCITSVLPETDMKLHAQVTCIQHQYVMNLHRFCISMT